MSLAIGLCRQLEELVAEHRARSVARIVLEIGPLSNVVGDLLREAIHALRQEVPLIEAATVEIREVPLEIHCHDCGRDTRIDEFRFWCPRCESSRVEVVSGEELLLRDVELELEEEKTG